MSIEILTSEEKFKNKTKLFSEEYIVKFWIKDGDTWIKKEKEYYAEEKDQHKKVVNRWKQDYKGQNAELICVVYQ